MANTDTVAKKKISLCMIVKNESKVIERCLASILPVIDYWVIVDTGSTDGTQDKIKKFFDNVGIPGELHERPWKNFGHNRSEALELAYANKDIDYCLMIDSDEVLVFDPGFDPDKFNLTLRVIRCLNDNESIEILKTMQEVTLTGYYTLT